MATRESFAEILRDLCSQRDWELLPSGVNVIYADGRHQVISFEIREFEERLRVRLATTIGGAKELRTEQLEQALRANFDLAHGALALDGDELRMIDTLPLEEVGPGEIESAVVYLAQMADYYEQSLFHTDTY